MISSITIDEREYRFDPSNPIDISIPLNFNGPQPNAYGVAPATSSPCAAGELVGDTRKGGSCNFEQYTFIPHCNGTHTECVGHITHERISVHDCLRDVLIPAIIITVTPESANDASESYSMRMEDSDAVITRRSIERSLSSAGAAPALIIRTLPNDDSKQARQFIEDIPLYFTTQAMQYIADRGVKHLLVDLPSIDRLYDEGRLSNHRIFWNVKEGIFEANENTRRNATISELIYVPNNVEDGLYLLNLQIAPFVSDASPSRPILFPIVEI